MELRQQSNDKLAMFRSFFPEDKVLCRVIDSIIDGKSPSVALYRRLRADMPRHILMAGLEGVGFILYSSDEKETNGRLLDRAKEIFSRVSSSNSISVPVSSTPYTRSSAPTIAGYVAGVNRGERIVTHWDALQRLSDERLARKWIGGKPDSLPPMKGPVSDEELDRIEEEDKRIRRELEELRRENRKLSR